MKLMSFPTATFAILASSLAVLTHAADEKHTPRKLQVSNPSDWVLVAHMAKDGPMFGGNTNFDPLASYGTFVSNPDPSTPDFYRQWPITNPAFIIFQTGNGQATYTCPYPEFEPFMVPSPSFERYLQCTFTDGSGQESPVNVNILMRGSLEDPWIDVGGEHCSNECSNILWGENAFDSTHVTYKNANDGVNVYIAPPSNNSGSNGDPHFKSWKDQHYQYHGQCDLVLAKDEDFANGLGLHVHIRTKLVRYWSYIKTAVIRIGNDILEIEGSNMEGVDKQFHFWTNFEYQGDLTEFAGFPVSIKGDGTKLHKNRFEIDLGSMYPGQKIILSTFKEFVKVDFVNHSEEAFGNTVGMLGDYKTGKTFARDGRTVLDDFTDLGREWQVLPSDMILFHEIADPQFPNLCIEPEDPQGDRRRRLDESSITEEEAESACAGLKDKLDRKDCVYDILATQDLDMAGAF